MYVLGISYGTHDSSACLIKDGQIRFAISEERLSRIKKDASFPLLSIKAALDYENISFDLVDCVAFGCSKPLVTIWNYIYSTAQGKIPLTKKYLIYFLSDYLKLAWQKGGLSKIEKYFGRYPQKVLFIDHHLAHAASAYYLSGFDKANVVVVDGKGAFEATSLWFGDEDAIRHQKTYRWPNSIGLLNQIFTEYLGFKGNRDEWKVMGLAAYGNPSVDLNGFARLSGAGYKVNTRKLFGKYRGDLSNLEKRFGTKRAPETELLKFHKNLAASLQNKTEEMLSHLLQSMVKRNQNRDLCLAGGVALNSKANGLFLSAGLIDRIFIQPASGDDGVALGAALAAYAHLGKEIPKFRLGNTYFGNDFSNVSIEKILERSKIRYTFSPNIEEETARLIADGLIIGWFQGRSEFGPRALGNRSILADPRDPNMNDRVNSCVKFREEWRPFAPSVLLEEYLNYFEAQQPSPFMTITFKVKKDAAKLIPAVTHVDGTSRIQTVEKLQNPAYWNLIKNFQKITGIPIVLNTSFNLRGEPIVETPQDAIKTFYCSGLDCLVLGNFLIQKNI